MAIGFDFGRFAIASSHRRHDAGDSLRLARPTVSRCATSWLSKIRMPYRSTCVCRHSLMNLLVFGPGAGGPLGGVVVGLVADEGAHRVGAGRGRRLHEVVELAERADRLGQGQIAVAAAGGRQSVGERLGAVGHVRAGAELVVGLLVRAAHPRGAERQAPRHDGDPVLRASRRLLRFMNS